MQQSVNPARPAKRACLDTAVCDLQRPGEHGGKNGAPSAGNSAQAIEPAHPTAPTAESNAVMAANATTNAQTDSMEALALRTAATKGSVFGGKTVMRTGCRPARMSA